jgi:hypothetical protein
MPCGWAEKSRRLEADRIQAMAKEKVRESVVAAVDRTIKAMASHLMVLSEGLDPESSDAVYVLSAISLLHRVSRESLPDILRQIEGSGSNGT